MAGSRGSAPTPTGLSSVATGVCRTRILRSGYVRAPRARRNKMPLDKRIFGHRIGDPYIEGPKEEVLEPKESQVITKSLQYQIFEGAPTQQMPLLIEQGLRSASISEIMQGRLEGKLDLKYGYHSGDAIAYSPDVNILIIQNSVLLRNINLNSRLENGALLISLRQYENLRAHNPELTRG